MCDSCETHHCLKWLFSTGGWWFYLFSSKFFSDMGSGDSDAAALAFKIRACELNISKSNVLLCNKIFGCDECPWIQYWGDLWKRRCLEAMCDDHMIALCFSWWNNGKFDGACAACTLSTQYQDLKVFLLWTVELLQSSLGWTVDLWNHPLPNRVWWKGQQSRWRAELRCEKIFLDPIVY